MGGPVHHQANNLVLRFALELGALAALFYWGLRTGNGPLGIALGLGAAAAAVRGLFASPRAHVPLPLAGRLAVEVVFFGSAAAGLVAVGPPLLAGLLFALAVANRALIQAWGQDETLRGGA